MRVVGDRHAVPQALGARRHLGIPGHQHGLRRIGPLGAEDVDHLVEVVLELALGAERPRVDGQEEVADVVGIGGLLRLVANG